jgi:hypothetical protein
MAIDQKKMCFTMDQLESIKGKEKFKQIKVSLALGRRNFPEQLISRLRVEAPIVVFYIPIGQKRIEAVGYVSGVWIRLFAVNSNPGNFRWYFTHIEKYMNRTFEGDTLELQSRLREICPGEKQHSPVDIDAFVRHRYTLEEVVETCSNVMFGKVAAIDKKKPHITIDEMEIIKGKEQIKKMRLNLAMGQADATKRLLDVLRIDAPLIIFYTPMSGKRIEALGYISGMWIRLFAVHSGSEALEWYFVHIEKYMNHIFEGDTLKLQSLIQEMVAEKKTARAKPR